MSRPKAKATVARKGGIEETEELKLQYSSKGWPTPYIKPY